MMKIEKYLMEKSIGKSGKERVRKFLYKQVDFYLKEVSEHSDDTDNSFFVNDFYKWYKDRWMAATHRPVDF